MFPELITELLQDGYKVNFSAPGHSMFPTIMANERIIVAPIDPNTVRMRDIILYRNKDQLIAHRVVSIRKEKNDAIKAARDSTEMQSTPAIEVDSTFLKLSARQAQRSSSAALQYTLRGDASNTCDMPVKPAQILGKVIAIERFGHRVDPYRSIHRISCLGLVWLVRSKRLLRTVYSIFATNGR